MTMFRALLVGLAACMAAGDNTYVMQPLDGKTGPEVAVVLIQGASCDPASYKPFAQAIQQASDDKVWIGVPEFIEDTPEPVQFGGKVKDVLSSMTKAGMNANFTMMVAHSLGGVMAQTGTHAAGADALVLYGATLLRNNRNTFPVPTLTIDGDLDGLLRVTRQAEAFYNQVTVPFGTDAQSAVSRGNPVVLLEGLTHWSIASGPAPSNVQKNDLKPEVAEDDAHAQIASLVADYIAVRMGNGDGNGKSGDALASIAQAVTATAATTKPILDAMALEGFHYLTAPCDSDYPTNPSCAYPKFPDKSIGPAKGPTNPPPPQNCTCGSPWVMQNAQRIMGDLGNAPSKGAVAGATITTKDAFHDVSDVRPFHLPHIFTPKPGTACKAGANGACEIESTTVTMPIYDSKDSLDTGLYPVTATEFRTKLKSRQAVWQAAGATNVDFNASDFTNASICQAINQEALDWALGHASAKALARYNGASGQPLRIVKDVYAGIGITGPTWIKKALMYTPTADNKAVEVSAPYFATENKNLGDEPYTNTVGYHYCKLLSPARAIEWIYVDGLKQFGGL